jgi:hypothetical protein
LAALGPLVLAAFGRSTRGSEATANLFASMNAKRLVQSRERGPEFVRIPARVSGCRAGAALAPCWYRAWTAQRCALAALGPLVLAAFGRFTRGSESAVNLFAIMKAN